MKTKRILCVACALILSACALFCTTSCAGRAPTTAEIYDRVVELVEGANEINTVFYGAGLPVHKTDSEYAEIMHIYYDFSQKGTYEMVTDKAIFLTSIEIKAAAEKVYSKDYLEDVIYPALFTGYAISDASGRPYFSNARYLEDKSWIYQYTGEKVTEATRWIYDYSTMKVVKPSSGTLCFVELQCYPVGSPEQAHVRKLSLVLQDGEWYLDSFTG